LDIDFQIILFAGDPTFPYGPWVRGRAYGGLNISRYSTQIHLTVGPVNPWTQLLVTFSVVECIIGTENTSSDTGRIPTLVPLACGKRLTTVAETKWTYSCLYQKQYHIPRGILEINSTFGYFKEVKLMFLMTFLFYLPTAWLENADKKIGGRDIWVGIPEEKPEGKFSWHYFTFLFLSNLL
jgi:hypothetical protein